jgi:hypothetical protein
MVVPEPSAMALLGAGACGAVAVWRGRNRRRTSPQSEKLDPMKKRSGGILSRFAAVACMATVAGVAGAAPFTPGTVVVSQFGNGVTASGTVPITLREFTTSGSATGVEVALPVADAGANKAVVGPISNTGIGLLKRSVDQRFLTIIGYGTNATASRTIARVDRLGGIDSTTQFSAAGASPRSAITTTGSDLWWSGDTGSGSTGGIRYTTLGSTSSGVALAQGVGGSGTNSSGLYPVPFNSRVIGIFNDQLYGSAAVTVGPVGTPYSFRGVFNVGTGIPTTANQYGATIVGGGTSNAGLIDSPWEFFIAGPSTIYVADDDTAAPATGGLQKWLFSSGSWSKVWTAAASGATGMRGLTGVVTGNAVQLYGITAVSTGTGANDLVTLSDTLDGTSAPSFSTLATASLNCVFRGVALAPVPEPSSVVLGLFGVGALAAVARRRGRKNATG